MSSDFRSVKISRILHAGYVFDCDGTQIAFDPIFENPLSGNCYAFPSVDFDYEKIRNLQFAAVFISHFHDDHCSLESLRLLDRRTPIYLYCIFEELFSMIRELGFENVYPLCVDGAVEVGPFTVTPRRALDSDVDSMFQIKAKSLNILNVVDSLIHDVTVGELVKEGTWDMVLWPFQTMLETDVIAPSRASPASGEVPSEFIEQLKKLNPRYVVPSSCQFLQESWSWYNQAMFPITYRQFQKDVEAALPKTQVVRLNPSVAVSLDQQGLAWAPSLSWVLPVGEQDVDYAYMPSLKPPSTADIARHFKPLTQEQADKVFEYCCRGLIEKFRSMPPPEDPYFEKARHWRLSLYDHMGEAIHFFYRLKSNKIELLENDLEEPSWVTEVPLCKVYAALELGESLTSMYMRINDVVFAPEVEEEIQFADIVDDPLIRCLFNGVFGAYQRAQLKRIKDQSSYGS